MLTKAAKRTFSSTQLSPFNVLGHFKALKDFVMAPRNHVRLTQASDDGNYRPHWQNLTNDAFDEVAAQWHAYYSQNPYFLQVYGNLDNVQNSQFGTVDNPVAVFTADAPFRYVGCTGLQNEDDYEQHENMMFMLREGPLQRCPMCGQVFKLIRLRPEYTEEMSFYQSCFHPLDLRELATTDNIANMNIFKINTHWEPSMTEVTIIDQIAVAVNQDEHARILTDPAYRLWKFKYASDLVQVFRETEYNIAQKYKNDAKRLKLGVQKRVYENLMEAEKALRVLDRHERKVARFNARKYLDYENHERRERRMIERANKRWAEHYVYYYGGLTEEEQRYRDYYETDQEIDPENEQIEARIDHEQVAARAYHPKHFDFQEKYTSQIEDDQTSLLEKKLFRFKYRAAEDNAKLYQARQRRMIKRQAERFQKDPRRKEVVHQLEQAYLSGDQSKIDVAKLEFNYLAAEEAFLLYRDYYQGDKNAEVELVAKLYEANPLSLLPIYYNYTAIKKDGYEQIPKRSWDYSLGLWHNYVLDTVEYFDTVLPRAQQLSNQGKLTEVLPDAEHTQFLQAIEEARKQAVDQLQSRTQAQEQPRVQETRAQETRETRAETQETTASDSSAQEEQTQSQTRSFKIEDPRKKQKKGKQ